MSMRFSPFQKQDYPELSALTKEIWQDAYAEILSQNQIDYMLDRMYALSTIEKQIDDLEIWEMVRNEKEELIGYLHFYPKNGMAFLSKIYLSKKYWNKNISTLLMKRVIDFAKQNHLHSIQLTVNKFNIRAQRFYEKMNFQRREEKVFDIGNGYVMDDYIYQKEIE